MHTLVFSSLLLGSFAAAPAFASATPPQAVEATTAAKPSPTKAIDPAAMVSALRLARFLYSEESQVRSAIRLVDTGMGPAMRQNELFIMLEGEYPGFVDALLAEAKPLIARHTREFVPEYQERIARIYAAHLSAAELDDLLEFYRSPTGKKMVDGMLETASLEAVLTEALEDPYGQTSYSAVAEDHRATAASVKKMMDASDYPTLTAFGRKPYARRVLRIGPEVRKLEQDLMNEPAPEFEAEMEKLFEAVLARFEAGAKASK